MVKKRQLSKRSKTITVPSFPTPYKQDYESWSKILMSYDEIGYITENTTFITHSLGGIFIVKFLLENQIKIKRIITVAGFNNLEFDDDMNLYKSFFVNDKLFCNLEKYCSERISFYSDDDPYVPQKEAEDFANCIKRMSIE